MNYYRYKLIAPSGQVSGGVVKLPFRDVMSATTHLERDGSITIFVKPLGPLLTFLVKLGSLRWRTKLNRAALAELLSNVALMLRSGMSLTSALREAAESSESNEVASDINDIILGIEGGMTFSEAADKYPNIFPKSVYFLIRMGEETGQLDRMLKDASAHLKRIQAIIDDTKQALLYPSFVFIAMTAGFLFWFYYVVPKIIELFRDMEVALPVLTIYLLKVSNFVQNYILQILLGGAAAIAVMVMLRRRSRFFKKKTDQLLLGTPVAGSVIKASNLAFISEYLALLLNAGIDILQSVAILKEAVGNAVYHEKLEDVSGRLTSGDGISASFKTAAIFPVFMVRMINVGEMSGTLTEQLGYVAEEYRNRLAKLVATLGKSIEPIVLVVAGTIFAVIIGALLLPIYDLVSRISG
jgi:general secretion pathway protein F/type IV pilus assembly protein PilC